MERGAQHGEDLWIAEHLRPPFPGVFVEVGASDGLRNSNTIYFEDRGWSGLVIEADPRNYDALLKRRCACECAAVTRTDNGPVEFTLDPQPDWSGISIAERAGQRTMHVRAYSLETMLTMHGIEQIDLLSIDTEGTELDVWASFDVKKHRPKIVILEYNTTGQPTNEPSILAAMAICGYRPVHRTKCNLIFVPQRHTPRGIP